MFSKTVKTNEKVYLSKVLTEKRDGILDSSIPFIFSSFYSFMLKQTVMNDKELEKSKVYITSQIVEYIPNSVASRTILEKPTGNIIVLSFDENKGLPEKVSPFDTIAHIVDGKAEIIIDGASYFMEKGECIIIPAHKPHSIKGNKRFKMILTIIKSGYE